MNTRLLLPPVKAATVQFPPSCPVVFFRSSAECATSTCDTEKSSCAGNGGDDEHEGIINPNIQRHGTAIGLGIVRSVYIDLSPESGRQLFYTIEVLPKRNRKHKRNKDMPPADSTSSSSASSSGTEDASALTSDEPETIQVPEWSLRYAPNCPALFDLSCFNNEDDDHDAQDRPSTIVSNVVAWTTAASSVVKGIILCGLPTLSEDEDGVTFVYSALVHHTDGDQYYEVHDIPLHAIRFDPTAHREVPSTDKASSSSTTFAATTTGTTTFTYDNDVTTSSFACKENNLEDPTDPIDATSSHKDEKDKEPKVIGIDIEHTFNDPMAIPPNTNVGSDVKSSKESSSPTSTSRRTSAKSSRRNRDRDSTPSPSKKSRSERSSEKKERRKKERRERSSSPRRSRRRDHRSRSCSRDRKSCSSRSRKHSYGSRSSRSRSLDNQRGRRSFSYDRYERRGRSPSRGHRSFSRSRSRERRERARSRRDLSLGDPSIRQRSCCVPAQPLEAMRPQGNHYIIQMPSKQLEYASSHTKDTSTTTPTWTPPAQVDKSRQVAFPRWLDVDSVVRAVSKHQQAFQEGQGFSLSVENFRIKVSLDGIMVDPDISPADLPRALLVIKERLCQLVKDDGAYHRLLYDFAVFDIEKIGHYDGGPVHVVDPLTDGASSWYTDQKRPWMMIIDTPYSQQKSSFHTRFIVGENGCRVLELQRQFGCMISVFHQRGGRTSGMCQPYISISSEQSKMWPVQLKQFELLFESTKTLAIALFGCEIRRKVVDRNA